MMSSARCDIVIPVHNRPELTGNCLRSIYARTHTTFGLTIIDNGSDADTKDFLTGFKSSHDNAVLISNESNLGWVKAVNQGIRSSSAPYVCIMNNDTIAMTDDWLSALIDVADLAADIGLVNPGFYLKRAARRAEKAFTEVDFCRGYCVLIKRAVIEKIGVLDEAYGIGYYDDDDYSVRAIRANFRCVMANNVTVRHLGDSTFKTTIEESKRRALHEKNKSLFYSKWGRRLRLFFILTGLDDRDKIAGMLLRLARRQHIIYLNNLDRPLAIGHINVREKAFPGYFPRSIFALSLFLNSKKSKAKRYDMIFTDDAKTYGLLAARRHSIHRIDTKEGTDRVERIVDDASRA